MPTGTLESHDTDRLVSPHEAHRVFSHLCLLRMTHDPVQRYWAGTQILNFLELESKPRQLAGFISSLGVTNEQRRA